MGTSNIGGNGNVFLTDYQDIDANTPLLPFRRTADAFWTMNDCRDTTVLGYAYPETQRWQYDSTEALASAAQGVISNLYGGRIKDLLAAQQAGLGDTTQPLLSRNNTFTDWTIETRAPASSLPSSFILRFSFIGSFMSDPTVEVGSWMQLMPEQDDMSMIHPAAPRPADVQEKILQGTTSLTAHLIEQVYDGKLESLKAVDVVPFLRDYLTWHVFTVCVIPTSFFLLNLCVWSKC
jgi:tyrosinase